MENVFAKVGSRIFSGWHSFEHRDTSDYDEATDHQQKWELDELIGIYKEIDPKKFVLEVGSYLGGTLKLWIDNGDLDTQFISVDIDIPQRIVDTHPYAVLTDTNTAISWRQWLRDDQDLHLIRKSSTRRSTYALVKQITDYVDFLYIDANHSYKSVKLDFLLYGQLVRPGGVIAFHDINVFNAESAVHKLWKEIQRAGYITQELIASDDSNGQGVIFI